jgi:hypothetical protein
VSDSFEGWAVVELMGHRRLAAYVSEQEIAGTAFLRLDIHGVEGGPAVTQFYGAGSVYCLTPTTEEIARRLGEQLRPQPVARYELEPAPSATANAPDTEPPW